MVFPASRKPVKTYSGICDAIKIHLALEKIVKCLLSYVGAYYTKSADYRRGAFAYVDFAGDIIKVDKAIL